MPGTGLYTSVPFNPSAVIDTPILQLRKQKPREASYYHSQERRKEEFFKTVLNTLDSYRKRQGNSTNGYNYIHILALQVITRTF